MFIAAFEEVGRTEQPCLNLKFAFYRRIYKQLEYDERSNPAARKALKRKMWKSQNRKSAYCPEPLELKDSELDRLDGNSLLSCLISCRITACS